MTVLHVPNGMILPFCLTTVASSVYDTAHQSFLVWHHCIALGDGACLHPTRPSIPWPPGEVSALWSTGTSTTTVLATCIGLSEVVTGKITAHCPILSLPVDIASDQMKRYAVQNHQNKPYRSRCTCHCSQLLSLACLIMM